MAENRPRGRERNVTGHGTTMQRRGEGLGTGPVGSKGGYQGRSGSSGSSDRGERNRSGNSSGGFAKILVLVLTLLFGGGAGLGSMLGNGDTVTETVTQQETTQSTDWGAFYQTLGGGSVSSGWNNGNNTGILNTKVASGSREKYTKILGNGEDKTTIMIYLCGTDLESRSKMATSDLQEMIDAKLSENLNLIVYTGGCQKWQNNALSNKTNQIWKIEEDGLTCLEKDMGSLPMTDPATLSSFINWCKKNFPANRNSLIFWDHGGGSVSGFGYDEKFANSGSMSLAEINQALKAGGVKFDFVGFDACLMATAENGLMLAEYADYMIASEETEPGIGWYYTDWLTEYSKNPSMSTLEIGKNIIDDFIDTCAKKCSGQSTTLSIVDLAELEHTIPEALTDFSADTYQKLQKQEYGAVSKARSNSREFGSSSKIDQVDLVHLAKNMGSTQGDALADVILDCVKYNRTSSNMTNSYGLSIYFPLRKAALVDRAVETYEQIGLDDEYSRCIQAFASMEVSGQAMSGGTSSPVGSLMDLLGSMGGTSAAQSAGQLLGSLLSGSVENIAGLSLENIGFLQERVLSEEEMVEYFSKNSFDTQALEWKETSDSVVIAIEEEQWELVDTLYANMFYDDGTGFMDLGLDNVYEFDEEGNLMAPREATWLAINNQPVAYYHESTVDDGNNYSITGRVPVLYNEERAELVLEFTDENPKGSVVGVRRVYNNGETETVAKTMETVQSGDVIDFVCDYYSYEGEYLDSYCFGERLVVEDTLNISDVYIEEGNANLTYMFTDLYGQNHWTTPVIFP